MARLQNVFRAHESLTGVLISLIDDLNFDLVMQSEDAVKRSSKVIKDLVTNQIAGLRNALEIAAQTHLVASVISEASVAKDAAMLVPFQDRFRALADSLAKVSRTFGDQEIKKAIADLLAFGQGDDSILALRGKELDAAARADRAIEENARIQRELDQAVSVLVSETEQSMKLGHRATDGTTRLQPHPADHRRRAEPDHVRRHRRALRAAQSRPPPLTRSATPCGACRRAIPASMCRRPRTAMRSARWRERCWCSATGRSRRSVSRARPRSSGASARKPRPRPPRSSAASTEEQTQVVRALNAGLRKLSDGDLTFRLTERLSRRLRGNPGRVQSHRTRLQETIQALSEATREVSNASTEISSSTMDLSQRTEEQAASLEQTSASLQDISAIVKKNADSAQQANASANSACDMADRNGQVVAKAVDAMAQIEESSRRISDIIGVIDEIARQTNLLALNAAVEAARAGEAGRGFAVVAAEVRSLAQRSSQAAKDIKELITTSSTIRSATVSISSRRRARRSPRSSS